MSSKKCNQCGLVNFANATHCKRCQIELNNFAPIASQRNYQTPANNLPAFQKPPPPPRFDESYQQQHHPTYSPNCNKCGENNDVSIQTFKKDYVPPVAYLGIVVGFLPVLILVLLLKIRHKIQIPFCDECYRKYKLAQIVEPLSMLGFFFAIAGGLYVVFTTAYIPVFLFFGILGFAFAAFGIWYRSTNSPKVKKIDRHKIIIETKVNGELIFQQ